MVEKILKIDLPNASKSQRTDRNTSPYIRYQSYIQVMTHFQLPVAFRPNIEYVQKINNPTFMGKIGQISLLFVHFPIFTNHGKHLKWQIHTVLAQNEDFNLIRSQFFTV